MGHRITFDDNSAAGYNHKGSIENFRSDSAALEKKSTRHDTGTSQPTTCKCPDDRCRPVSHLNPPTPTFYLSSLLLLRQTQPQPNFQIDNIFAPRPNGPITRSITKLIDTTEKVVNGFAGMFRSTLEIITGTG